MNGLLSTISGYFSRSLILGAFLPTVIFVSVFLISVYPLLPEDAGLFVRLGRLSPEWKIISMTFFTIVASGLLYNLNDPLTRLYEGYPWRNTRFGKWRTCRQLLAYQELDNRQKGMRTLLRAMNRLKAKLSEADFSARQIIVLNQVDVYLKRAPRTLRRALSDECHQNAEAGAPERWDFYFTEISKNWNILNRKRLAEYPENEGLILPTKLGNVIRAFEYYPKREYGMDAIVLYPRLVAKIDREYAALIDDAKTSFDFMLNSSLLSSLLLGILLIVGLTGRAPFRTAGALLAWLTAILLLSAVSGLAYLGAVNRAAAWGETVKSAFDLFRRALLEQLGFAEHPKTRLEESSLWTAVSKQIIYGNDLGKAQVDYNFLDAYRGEPPAATTAKAVPVARAVPATGGSGTPAPTAAAAVPTSVKLPIFRSLEFLGRKNAFRVTLEIENNDPDTTEMKDVVISETLPDGWVYRSVPAILSPAPPPPETERIRVGGLNPYYFPIGSLRYGERKKVTYEILSLKKNKK